LGDLRPFGRPASGKSQLDADESSDMISALC